MSNEKDQLPEWVEFIKACKRERFNFVDEINSLPWHRKTRTVAENLLVMYDQLVERYSRMQEENNKLREALEELLEAIPKQTEDCDWWEDDLTDAVNNAKALINKP